MNRMANLLIMSCWWYQKYGLHFLCTHKFRVSFQLNPIMNLAAGGVSYEISLN